MHKEKERCFRGLLLILSDSLILYAVLLGSLVHSKADSVIIL